ncbi:LysM peptidoglycan-binding domain-containing protein [Jiangella asiatica]|uniref:LysM peptidoglycan-binding domain-containing protein n=1 Tax=Jiangella asiatica TaxID=2530372 RepID=UPI0013A5D674|nr:LysM peptidoglycan-binding domain-containing protein [Jiangella asiatica]
MTVPPLTGSRAVARGLTALLGLTLLVVGLPAVLWAVDGWPLPGDWPDLRTVREAALRPDDGSLFLGALIVAGWAGWATFVLSLLVELPAAVRGTAALPLPGLGAQQRLVAAMVAAVAAIGGGAQAASASSATPSPWEPAAPVTTDLLDQQAAPDGGERRRGGTDPPTGGDLSPARAAMGTYVVREGDTLWHIADASLGDPTRYPEIVAASAGTVQPDGRRLTDPDVIHPGWTLTVPGAPTSQRDGLPDTGSAGRAGAGTVAPDTGSADEKDAGTVRPDAGSAGRAGAATMLPDAEAPGLGSLVAAPAAGRPIAAAPDCPPGPIAGAADEPTAGGPMAAPDPEEDPDGDGATRTIGGVGAVLAAGLIAVLTVRRARRQRRRRPGERLAPGSAAARTVETELRQVADQAGVAFVDRALRGLAARLAESGRQLPPLRAARLTSHALELYLAASSQLPAPFVGTAHGGVWTVEASQTGPLDGDGGARVPAPYPSLVSIGHDRDDALVLLDLEQLGSLVVDGPPELVGAAIAAIAAELATSTWADDLRVSLVGGDWSDLDLLRSGRVRRIADVEELIDEITVRVTDDRLLLATAGVNGLAAARVGPVAEATWTPEILVVAVPLPDDQWSRLCALIETAPRVAVAAVIGGGSAGQGWTLRLAGTTLEPAAVLEPLGVPLRPQLLDAVTRERVTELLHAADSTKRESAAGSATVLTEPGPAQPPDEMRRARASIAGGPSPPERSGPPFIDPVRPGLPPGSQVNAAKPAPHGVTAPSRALPPGAGASAGARPTSSDARSGRSPDRVAPRLLMLGPVEVAHTAELVEQTKLGQLTELAMFIALNPGCDTNAIDDAIWPGSAVTRTTRGTAISKLRRWLGTDATGASLLPRTDGGYTYLPDVRSDWQDWCALLPEGPARATTAELRAALSLVRGRPFSGRGRRRYAWVDHIAQEMISSIVDTCHELALHALADAAPGEALRAALLGLSVEPGVELLWRDRLKAELAVGDRSTVLESIGKLRSTADDLGGDLEPETEELIERITSGSGRLTATG